MRLSDNSRANSPIRLANIEMLESQGFEPSGVRSRSGELEIFCGVRRTCITFGVKSNVAGKYFTLVKSYPSLEAAEKAWKYVSRLLLDSEVTKPKDGIAYAYHSRYSNEIQAYKTAKGLMDNTEKHAYVARVTIKKERVYDVRHQQV